MRIIERQGKEKPKDEKVKKPRADLPRNFSNYSPKNKFTGLPKHWQKRRRFAEVEPPLPESYKDLKISPGETNPRSGKRLAVLYETRTRARMKRLKHSRPGSLTEARQN